MKLHRPPCLEWRERLALRHEDLSPADQQALDDHVRTCEACAGALADYHFFEARLEALPPPSIRPLPRLSPHFFEHDSELLVHEEQASIRQQPSAKRVREKPGRGRRARTIVWHALSVAAVLCLLLSAGAVFRVLYIAHLASHPSGATLFDLDQHTGSVYAVGWSPDGQEIATASADHTVKVWSASTGNLICTYTSGDEVYALAWSPDSRLIASGGADNTVHIWSASNCTGNSAYASHTGSGPIASIAWSPDGTSIASGGWGDNTDNLAEIWNVTTGQVMFSIHATEFVASISWSHNGQEIAVGSWDGTAQVWNMQTRRKIYATNLYNTPINAVALSPDGRYLAMGIQNNSVEIGDIQTNKIVSTYTQHTNVVNTVAWSPDGTYLASGGNDDTVRVWKPFSPATPTVMVYTQHTNSVSSIAWSPNGKEIVSGSFDTTARVWVVTF